MVMKKYYVYELVNLLGTIEYVGETATPKRRFYSHTKLPPKKGVGAGRFYNRSDIFMNIVKEFDNKKEAFDYQIELQKEYGLVTDIEKLKKNGFQKGHSVIGRWKPVKVKAYDLYGNYIKSFKSVGDAANELNVSKAGISMVINGNTKQIKGYKFLKI
jgi:predicted GIY-YIG superfamily endonuclease